MSKATMVRARQHGFYNGTRIREGQVFHLLPGHRPSSWMEEVVEAVAKQIVPVKAAKAGGKDGNEDGRGKE